MLSQKKKKKSLPFKLVWPFHLIRDTTETQEGKVIFPNVAEQVNVRCQILFLCIGMLLIQAFRKPRVSL